MRKKILSSLLLATITSGILYGAQTKTEISMLYVAIYNRASEGEGNQFWQSINYSMEKTATEMLASSDSKAYFGTSWDSNQLFIEHIYRNTLNKTLADDSEGINFWVSRLNNGTSRGKVVRDLVNAAANGDFTGDANALVAQAQFNNRVEVSNYMADTVFETPSDYATSTSFGDDLTVTNSTNTIDTANGLIDLLAGNGEVTPTPTPSANIAPTANAGVDKTVTVNETITLSGSGTDSDGTIVSYEWKKGDEVLGTDAILNYTPTEVGTDVLTLVVVDDDGVSGSDSVNITILAEEEDSGFGGKK